jgi:hypothetical protein
MAEERLALNPITNAYEYVNVNAIKFAPIGVRIGGTGEYSRNVSARGLETLIDFRITQQRNAIEEAVRRDGTADKYLDAEGQKVISFVTSKFSAAMAAATAAGVFSGMANSLQSGQGEFFINAQNIPSGASEVGNWIQDNVFGVSVNSSPYSDFEKVKEEIDDKVNLKLRTELKTTSADSPAALHVGEITGGFFPKVWGNVKVSTGKGEGGIKGQIIEASLLEKFTSDMSMVEFDNILIITKLMEKMYNFLYIQVGTDPAHKRLLFKQIYLFTTLLLNKVWEIVRDEVKRNQYFHITKTGGELDTDGIYHVKLNIHFLLGEPKAGAEKSYAKGWVKAGSEGNLSNLFSIYGKVYDFLAGLRVDPTFRHAFFGGLKHMTFFEVANDTLKAMVSGASGNQKW